MKPDWNMEELATNRQRREVLEVLKAGLDAVLVEPAIERKIRRNGDILEIEGKEFDLEEFENIYVIGAGKASARMAKEIEAKLGERIDGGVVISEDTEELEKIESLEGEHPVPQQKNVKNAEKVVEVAEEAGEDDLVLTLISGGGSALLALPRIPLEEFREVNRKLIESGEPIGRFNTVRKHLSEVKGGDLLEKIYPARSVSLIISDVVGDNLSTIASGPTVRDPTTSEEAKEIMQENDIEVRGIDETPKHGKYFERVDNILLLSGDTALEAMKAKAEELGLDVERYSRDMEGNVRDASRKFMKRAEELEPGTALLAAGETTVNVTGDGKGGRNQEFVLAGLESLSEMEEAALGSLATDGEDFIPVAGAVADQETLKEAQEKGLDPEEYLEDNDSYHFFEEVGNCIIDTGRTGTNVADIVCLVKC